MKPVISPRTTRCRARILVVDDTQTMRWMLAELLQTEGYEVEVASTAAEALQLTSMVRWDGLIMDVDLRDMSGMELYVRILEANGVAHLPVIFFTSRPCGVLQLGLGDVPWARLVPRPCSSRQLLSALAGCLEARAEAALVTGN